MHMYNLKEFCGIGSVFVYQLCSEFNMEKSPHICMEPTCIDNLPYGTYVPVLQGINLVPKNVLIPILIHSPVLKNYHIK